MAVIGNSTIFPIELAASIANTARSVGIVRRPSGPESEGLAVGTGFLVLEDQSVSGFHPRIRALLPSAAPIAAHVVAATVEPTGWAALRLEEPSSRPPLALAAATTAAPGDGVIIVQHATGGPKKFVLEPEGIVGVGHLALAGVDPDSPLSRLAPGVTDDELVHVADNEPGSSGAPVFDMRLRVIGMHMWGSREAQVNVGLGVEAIRRGLEEHGISFVEAAPPT